MARVDIVIPEPTPIYTEDNQEIKNEIDAFNYFLS